MVISRPTTMSVASGASGVSVPPSAGEACKLGSTLSLMVSHVARIALLAMAPWSPENAMFRPVQLIARVIGVLMASAPKHAQMSLDLEFNFEPSSSPSNRRMVARLARLLMVQCRTMHAASKSARWIATVIGVSGLSASALPNPFGVMTLSLGPKLANIMSRQNTPVVDVLAKTRSGARQSCVLLTTLQLTNENANSHAARRSASASGLPGVRARRWKTGTTGKKP